MSAIASKNIYEALGNDPDQDPNREPEPPTKAIDKPVARRGKRDGGAEDVSAARSARGARQDGGAGFDRGFRDRASNRNAEDGLRQDRHTDRLRQSDAPFRGRGRGRGRGSRGGPPRDDRHSKTGIAPHEKQAAHGWGGQTGGEEWADERAGEAIAKEEEKAGFDAVVEAPVNAEGEQPEGGDEARQAAAAAAAAADEAEDKTKSYDDYLAEQAEKKLQLGGSLAIRKANEGGRSKFPEGKAFARDEAAENYMAGTGGKASRTREKKAKQQAVELDDERLHRAPDLGGGRGRGRGRAEAGGFRGEGRGRAGRGARGGGGGPAGGGGERGAAFEGRGRGARGGRGGPSVNVNDQSAFPSLGA